MTHIDSLTIGSLVVTKKRGFRMREKKEEEEEESCRAERQKALIFLVISWISLDLGPTLPLTFQV